MKIKEFEHTCATSFVFSLVYIKRFPFHVHNNNSYFTFYDTFIYLFFKD